MDALWAWQLEIIEAIQSLSHPLLDGVFIAFTVLGARELYILLFAFLIWCVDHRLGVRLTVLFLVSAWLNDTLKEVLAHPRPFELEATVQRVFTQGHGLPSGHAQHAVVVWGRLASGGALGAAAAVGLIVAIGVSRVWLGVHFPTDVLAGWLLGVLVLAAGVAFEEKVAGAWRRAAPAWRAALVVGLFAAGVLALGEASTAALGALAGVAVGSTLVGTADAVSAARRWRIRRFVAGLTVLVGLELLFRVLAPEGVARPVWIWTHYLVLGLWLTAGLPRAARRFGAAGAAGERQGP